ncbi:DUF3592 domain-containing protein [Chryseobacterium jejuense]|uniref:Protein of uncharacterized function (DUF3592) n=1 Tax=Chryseobacterium jejuense TaxID=445960 RepID=A0A2X2ZAF3_CHRJE|nr:DUF3592 domain-containing protein [Chryseobacterium jejuense]SDI19373.1 Protein of unknown function [Chryseobacterium jejuense]SQB46649.1 Protein of uncharacterised function (DUF3592) [Chryseobacterium jejuense]
MSENKSSGFFITTLYISFIFVLLTLGTGGIFYSIQKLGKNFSLVVFGNKTTGKIIGYEGSYSTNNKGNSTKMYSPLIQYEDNKGIVREYHSDYSSSSQENDDEVTMYYNSEKPQKATRGGFLNLFFWPFLILGMSVLALSVGCYFGQPIFVVIKKIVKKIFSFLQ